MREIRLYGSEGGGVETNRSFLPLFSRGFREAILPGPVESRDRSRRDHGLDMLDPGGITAWIGSISGATPAGVGITACSYTGGVGLRPQPLLLAGIPLG